MQKKFQVVAFAIMVWPISGVAQDQVNGEMRCAVKSNNVTEIKDGQPKTYSGFENQFKVNDVLELGYALQTSVNVLEAWLRDNSREQFILRIQSKYKGWERSETQFYAPTQDVEGTVSFGSDWIFVDSSGRKLRLQRYFKNDWHGIGLETDSHFSSTSIAHQIYTLDCRTVTDKIDEVLSILAKELPK